MSKTDSFFTTTKEYQEKRRTMNELHEKNLALLEKHKGSQFYDEQYPEEMKQHAEDVKKLRAAYAGKLGAILDSMQAAIDSRPLTAPTADQLNTLQLLRMREKVTARELRQAAVLMNDNPLALNALQEIAQKHKIRQNFRGKTGEMDLDTAEQKIGVLRGNVRDFLEHETSRTARAESNYHTVHYGTTDRKLPLRRMFETRSECFGELGQMSPEELNRFSDVVD